MESGFPRPCDSNGRRTGERFAVHLGSDFLQEADWPRQQSAVSKGFASLAAGFTLRSREASCPLKSRSRRAGRLWRRRRSVKNDRTHEQVPREWRNSRPGPPRPNFLATSTLEAALSFGICCTHFIQRSRRAWDRVRSADSTADLPAHRASGFRGAPIACARIRKGRDFVYPESRLLLAQSRHGFAIGNG